MKYRAIAIGVMRDGRPLQVFSVHEGTVLKWAEQTVKAEKCDVEVYILEERRIKLILAKHE